MTRAILLAGTLVLAVASGALHYADANPVAVFVTSGLALAALAWVVSAGTEAVGAQFGPAATGVLQSTLGNLPELFIVLFAISAGELLIAQAAILGSLFANAFLVLGLSILAGAWHAHDGVMRFKARLPNDTATLLILAVFIIALVGVSHEVDDPASEHAVTISALCAVLLLSVYAVWLWGYLRGPDSTEPQLEPPAFSFRFGLVLLAAGGVGAAFVADWFVSSLSGAIDTLGISRAFTGIVIVGIAGNAVEHAVGITLAAKGKSDLAISVIKNSVAQIAVFLFPMLVLLSLFFEQRLTFVLGPVAIAALVLMALAIWQITGDGEALAFEGWALVALYLTVAVIAWFE
ncbi:MAG: Ca2+:H+ antiporter [Gaiellaceae bacterium]|nr:Ca2+:H+ antiporter [Gaiellaceae bacterium]